MAPTTEQSRRYQTRNRFAAAQVLDAIKLEAGCVDCGYAEHPAALQFDHVDPNTKRRELGWFNDRGKLKTKARLDRFIVHVQQYCVVRCANCHSKRTSQEQHWLVRRDDSADLVDRNDVLF